MPLQFLGGPEVVAPIGVVTEIINAKEPGANSMVWSLEAQLGTYIQQRRYVNTLRIFTSSPLVGPIQIQQALLGNGIVQGGFYRFPLPEYRTDGVTPITTPTEIDTGSFVQSIDLKQDSEDARQWVATIQYSGFPINHELGSSEIQNGSVNPEQMYPEVHWSSAKYEATYPTDLNGNPYRNTVGDPFDSPPPTEETRQVLTFVRNEAVYVESWASQYRDSVNSDNFLGFLPNTVKCKDIQGQRQYTADYGNYWKVSYEFEFRIGYTKQDGTTTGWTALVLNAGLRQNVNGVPAQITINNSLITSPVALTQDGLYDPAADPVYLEFTLYPALPFSFLNIPDNVLDANQ